MKRRLHFAIFLVAGVSVLCVLVCLPILYPRTDNYYGKPYNSQAPNFVLTDHEERKVTLEQFRDKIVLIAWGYTNCPDICPLTLAKLKKAVGALGDKSDQVQVLFLTVDPERDTPERLKSYVPFFDKNFLGVTGSQEDIEKIAGEYGVTIVKHPPVYGRSEEDHWDRYLLTHTNTVFVVDREGALLLAYPHYQSDPEGIAGDIKKLLQ